MTPSMDWLPTDPWVACTAPLTTGTAARSPGLTVQVANQFEVPWHPRYTPRTVGPAGHMTFCNVYLADVTKALGCAIPHVDLTGKGGWGELDANATIRWLSAVGPRHGWQPIDAEAVPGEADAGKVLVATWLNPGGIGHVALVVPSFGAVGPLITQAGARNFEGEHVTHGFGTLPVKYYLHP